MPSSKFYLLFLVIIFINNNAYSASQYKIFVLHSYSQEYPWTKNQHEGFIETYNTNSTQPALITTEHLDTKRKKFTPDYAQKFTNYLTDKYAGYTPDIIYVTDDNATQFSVNNLSALFPSTPIIFSGVNNFSIQNQLDRNKTTGVFEKKEISPNIKLLELIDENINEIIVLGDNSNTDRAIKYELAEELKLHPKIKANYIQHNQIVKIVSDLKSNDNKYLFLTTIGGIVNEDGQNLTLDQSLKKISSAGEFVIISMEDSYLLKGVLGGYVTSGRKQGHAAANLVLKYQKNTPIKDIPFILNSPNEYIFNYDELKKNNLKLPDSILSTANLLNIPPSFYQQNKTIFFNTIIILSTLIILLMIVFLILISRKNKTIKHNEKIELERLSKIERYQNALLEWSRVDYENIDQAFNRATEISANTLDISRVSIWLYNEDYTSIQCHNLYVHKLGHEKGFELFKKDFPNYFKAVESGKMIIVNHAREDERTNEFTEPYLIPNNIYSMLDAPIYYAGEIIGVVCHEYTNSIHTWTSQEQEFASAIASTVSLSLEIQKRKEIENALEHQAYHDALTKLPNRSLFIDRLDQALKLASRNQTILAVLFLDLDNFKEINDSLGHDTGDQVLINIADRLNANLREIDTIARLGGDEFTLIVSGFEDSQFINSVVQKLLNILQQPLHINGHELYATSSIGISIFPDNGETSEILLKNADAAMYKAKESGRNSFEFYTHDMTERAFEHVFMESNLRRALEQQEFIIYYQPQYNASTKKIIGMEALLRWEHPEMGMVSPVKFIPIAEKTGLIIEIDRWVMQNATQQISQWHQSGLHPGRLSLNMATKQLEQKDLLEFIKNTLQENKCKPEWISFEITESQIMKNPEKAISLLEEISMLGIEIAVDDFGTGYSSLTYLKRLPVDKLKIDRAFINELPNDDEDVAIVRAIIALSKSLKLSVIAEGAENKQQVDFLLAEGCAEIQGFFFAKPMPADKIKSLLIK